MNIFAFSECPMTSALWLDDLRKNKMITESCQIMSTVMNIRDPNHGCHVFQNFNPKHGSIQWALTSEMNFRWLLTYTTNLLMQRPYNVNGEQHGCTDLILDIFPVWLVRRARVFPLYDLTKFSNNAANDSVGLSFKWVSNTNLAYRMYITERWKLDYKKPTWKFGKQPDWYCG